MTKTYSQSIKDIAWAYILLCFHFKIVTIDLLPDWYGYYLIYTALPVMEKRAPSVGLLKNFVVFMTGYEAVEWFLQIFGVELDTYILSLFIGVVYIYTHFQLLTNLADIARQDSSEYSIPIRQLRSFVIVGVTITNIINSFFPNIWLVYGIAIINILIFTILSAQLFSYAKEEQKREELQVN